MSNSCQSWQKTEHEFECEIDGDRVSEILNWLYSTCQFAFTVVPRQFERYTVLLHASDYIGYKLKWL